MLRSQLNSRIWLLVMLLVGSLVVAMFAVSARAATKGDVSGDGKTDIADALLTLRYTVNLIDHTPQNNAVYLAAADVAPLEATAKTPWGNGSIDIGDALAILRYSVKLDPWYGTLASTSVPDLANLNQDSAITALRAACLVPGVVSQAYSATVPVGMVVSQLPVASGTVAPGTVVDLVVSKGAPAYAWGSPVPIESSAQSTSESHFAMNAAGDAMAVWLQNDGSRQNVWANRFTAAGGWETPQLLETADGQAGWPQVALSANGDAVAVWNQQDGINQSIWASRYTVNGGWGGAQPIDVSAGPGRPSREPRVAIDGSGGAIAVWSKYNGSLDDLVVNRYLPGTGWGTASSIVSDANRGVTDPALAMNAAGDAVVVWGWFDLNTLHYERVAAMHASAGSGWGAVQDIEDSGGGSGSSQGPQVAIDDNGTAVAVWKQWDGANLNIMANRYAGGWGTAEAIDGGNGYAIDPHVAVNAAGTAVAIWLQDDGAHLSVFANRYTAGSGWGAAQGIESGAGDAGIKPRVAIDASGNAMAVWSQSDGSRYTLKANRATASDVWGAEQVIGTIFGGGAESYHVAYDGLGRAMAVWCQAPSGFSPNNTYANRYQ